MKAPRSYKGAHLHARKKNRVKKKQNCLKYIYSRRFARMTDSEDRCGSEVVLTTHKKASGLGKVHRLSKKQP